MEALDILKGKYQLPLELDELVNDLIKVTQERQKPFSKKELTNLFTFFKPFHWEYFRKYLDGLGHAYDYVVINMDKEIQSIMLQNRSQEAMESVVVHVGRDVFKNERKEVIKRWTKLPKKKGIVGHSKIFIKIKR